MLKWFKQKTKAPKISNNNPGLDDSAEFTFPNTEKPRIEKVNLVKCLSDVLKKNKIKYKTKKTWILLNNGLAVLPRIVSIKTGENEHISTITTLQINHADLIINGLFEYQTATGKHLYNSIYSGFHHWTITNLPVFIDAVNRQAAICSVMDLTFGQKTKIRRAILGPITNETTDQSLNDNEDEHPFCPCCFLTQNFKSFQHLLKDNNLYGISFFASRDKHGKIHADCRINGVDYEIGKEALIQYAKNWKDAGAVFRKQYIVLQSLEKN